MAEQNGWLATVDDGGSLMRDDNRIDDKETATKWKARKIPRLFLLLRWLVGGERLWHYSSYELRLPSSSQDWQADRLTGAAATEST